MVLIHSLRINVKPGQYKMYSNEEKDTLIQQVKSSILYGLNNHKIITVEKSQFTTKLIQVRACFVTLYFNKKLRGCIGTLDAYRPLIEDVNCNAFAAAFEDPRFQKLTSTEFESLNIEISVLSIPDEIYFEDEDNLLSQLRIGVDGLIFEYGQYRSTYLPTVWNSLKTPREFLNSLKVKAGLDSNFWSNAIQCYRYTTELIK